jgi:hypothetical protein
MKRLPKLREMLLVLAITIAVVTAASQALASPGGMAAANQVSQTSYRSFLGDNQGVVGIMYTHNGSNRNDGPNHDLARTNVYNKLQSYGLSVALESFTYNSSTYYNVVATKTGTTHPNDAYIVGSHFDSVACPGADDNASGVCLVLETARILSQYSSDYTIRFIAFDREEQGLVGSDAYVAAHPSASVMGMISADMVSYDTGGNHCRMYGRTSSNTLKLALGSAITTYGGLTWANNGSLDASDHAPFEWAGYQACCLIEDYTTNPNYHTTGDSVDTANYINYAYAVKMTRSVVGYLVDAAGVNVPLDGLAFSYPNGRPTYSYPPGGPTLRVNVTGFGGGVPQPGTGVLHYLAGLGGWQTTPMTEVSPNIYDALFPAANCGATVQYYISAQMTSGTTFKDPLDAPTTTYSTSAGYGVSPCYQNNLDANPGWSIQGQWAFGHPTGGGSHNHDPSNGYTGTNVYGYNLSGDYANGLAVTYYLTTTPINCTGKYGVKLDFYRWLGVESDSDLDKATIQASNNGSTWTTIWQAAATGGAVSDASWQHVTYDIASVANNRPAVRIRWGMGPTDANTTYPGWNIDDVSLLALQCTPSCSGPTNGDMNGDGKVDGADIQAFVDAVIARSTDPAEVCPGDFSGNLIVDMADAPAMTNALLGT